MSRPSLSLCVPHSSSLSYFYLPPSCLSPSLNLTRSLSTPSILPMFLFVVFKLLLHSHLGSRLLWCTLYLRCMAPSEPGVAHGTRVKSSFIEQFYEASIRKQETQIRRLEKEISAQVPPWNSRGLWKTFPLWSGSRERRKTYTSVQEGWINLQWGLIHCWMFDWNSNEDVCMCSKGHGYLFLLGFQSLTAFPKCL